MTNGAILSTTTITLDQCFNYIKTRDHGEYTDIDLLVILASYYTYAQQVGIDAGIVISQMLLETGNLTSWWSARPRRNPCGYGVTGEQLTHAPLDSNWQIRRPGLWVRGYAFSSWDNAAKTHIAHLLCYALKDQQMNSIQRNFSESSPRKNLLPLSYRGCARTVFDLSTKWAADPKYGQAIMSFYTRLASQK